MRYRPGTDVHRTPSGGRCRGSPDGRRLIGSNPTRYSEHKHYTAKSMARSKRGRNRGAEVFAAHLLRTPDKMPNQADARLVLTATQQELFKVLADKQPRQATTRRRCPSAYLRCP